jgi:hypothetical protein
MRRIWRLAAAFTLSGCGIAAEREGQHILISTNPPTAMCKVDRTGARLADVVRTPGYVLVGKSSADLLVTCTKAGYQTVTLVQPAHPIRPRTGNVVVSRGSGAVIDAATGGDYAYPGEIALDLQPRTAGGNALP